MTSNELISRIEAQWKADHPPDGSTASRSGSRSGSNLKAERLRHFEADSENEGILRMFGCGLPRMETNAYYSSIEQLHFHFVAFNDLTKYFNFIQTLKTVTTLKFEHNDIHSLYQIDALSVIAHLKAVDFGAESGSNAITVTSPSLYRSYCVFRLPNIERIDGRAVSAEERESAKAHFSTLREEWKNKHILLTRGFCAPILDRIRSVNLPDAQRFGLNMDRIFKQSPFTKKERESVTKDVESQGVDEEESESVEQKSNAQQCIQRAIDISKSRRKLNMLWPSIVAEYVHEVVQDLMESE